MNPETAPHIPVHIFFSLPIQVSKILWHNSNTKIDRLFPYLRSVYLNFFDFFFTSSKGKYYIMYVHHIFHVLLIRMDLSLFLFVLDNYFESKISVS